MVRSLDAGEELEEADEEIPEDAHIIVAGRDFGARAPEGHPEDMLLYEYGDEVPREAALSSLSSHPYTLAVVDDDGEPIASGLSRERLGEIASAVQAWKEGGFEPEEYDSDGS